MLGKSRSCLKTRNECCEGGAVCAVLLHLRTVYEDQTFPIYLFSCLQGWRLRFIQRSRLGC
jgi:hypothetical protein